MRALFFALGCTPFFAAACGYDQRSLELPPPPVPAVEEASPPIEPENARERLQVSTLFWLEPDESLLQVSVGRHAEPKSSTRFGIVEGKLAARATTSETLVLQGLETDVEDVIISKESLPPDGLHLTAIHAILAFEDVTVDWESDANRASFEGRSTLRVEWSLVTDGDALEGRPLIIDDIPVSGELEADGAGRLAIAVAARSTGLLVDWGDLIEVSDLSFMLKLTERTAGQVLD